MAILSSPIISEKEKVVTPDTSEDLKNQALAKIGHFFQTTMSTDPRKNKKLKKLLGLKDIITPPATIEDLFGEDLSDFDKELYKVLNIATDFTHREIKILKEKNPKEVPYYQTVEKDVNDMIEKNLDFMLSIKANRKAYMFLKMIKYISLSNNSSFYNIIKFIF